MIKTILISVIMVFAYYIGNAQTLTYGLEGGYVHNNIFAEGLYTSGGNGFKAGGIISLSLKNKVCFESGLSFIRKSGKTYMSHAESGVYSGINKIDFSSMYYLQIPLMIGYTFNINSLFSIKPEFGGYYAVGLSGDSFITGVDLFGQPYESRVSTFSGSYGKPYRPCNRNDIGLSVAVNLSYRHIGLKVGYDIAMTNATYYGNGRHRTFYVSAVYLFHFDMN